MFKIGEFSMLTQVSIRMLRYYHEIGLLKPARIDSFSGYRLYAAEQIPVLNQIIFLRDLGFGVSEIQKALVSWDDDYIAELLSKKQDEIHTHIQLEQDKLKKIELAKADIGQEKLDIHYNVAIKSVPGVQVLSLRRRIPDYYAEGSLWKELSAYAHQNRISISNETFSIYHDPEYKEIDVDVEICVPVAAAGKSAGDIVFRTTETVPYMAYSFVYGRFENIAGAFLAFANWLQNHTLYKMTGQSRQIVHRGPWNEKNENNYLTEIQIPLMKIK